MWLDEMLGSLNEYQKKAVEDESKACLVKANVGSGKTTVLVAKILYLHEKKGIPYDRMVVLTFTNKAADEIRKRLRDLDSAVGAGDLCGFGTFHSVALRLLRDRFPVEALGYRRDFAVIGPEEELELASALAAEHRLRIKYKNRLKKRMEQEREGWLAGRTVSRYGDDLFVLLELLEQEKVQQNKLTFSDLISACIRLLQEAREALFPEWIIVDEVQDSDRQQLELITALMGEQTRLFAVGDPNQVIYSWRGSEENIFYLLSRRFEARELSLPVNYRSSDSILAAARCFQQGGERLQGSRGEGEKIHVKNHYDPFQEAEYLAGRIKGLVQEGASYRDIAVFYRLQSQSETLEKVFDRYGIPYAVSVKKTVSDLPALSWFAKVLRSSCNPQDGHIREAVLTDRMYGNVSGLAERMERFRDWALTAAGKGVCDGGGENGSEDGPACSTVPGSLPRAQEIYDYFDLDKALKPSSASFAEEKGQLLSFCGRILDYVRQEELDFLTGITAFLNSAALYGIKILEEDADERQDAVRLMTLHASKGLEFQYVFIIGVNYGLIPLQSKSWEEEEEERRLFFVGLTRARDYLELSWYTNPARPQTVPGESRYLEMIPERLLVREDRKRKGAADLAELRRAVQEAKGKKQEEERAVDRTDNEKKPDRTAPPRRVRHERYGIGTVTEEDESKITVEFEGYGVKEFLKAFTKLEEAE